MKYLLYLLVFSSITCYAQEEEIPNAPMPKCVEETKQDGVKDYVQIQPQFPGGINAMMPFVSKHFKYPLVDLENKIEGTVYVSFIVELDGSLTDVKVMRGISKTLDAEAVRVIKSMPNWTPGEQVKGKPVRSRYILPIKARLS